ncbi:MAG TPA: tetratricopeptide repeat protein, partial [Chthonomonadaceae bacterium]|nr:tetratricopeptide repeat protein [Chthonomonadaceae bacterium]
KPGFALTDENAAAVLQICRRLDGIPLALEMAAARVGLLSVEQIARFDDYFRLLTGGNRTGLFHHQTLKAALDWSFDLLTEPEQALFRRLSFFAGGWTLEAAEAVCGADDYDVLDLLSRLVECSLVIAEEQEDSTRYRMLETIRQYAYEKLTAAGEADLFRERHRDYFLALAERAELYLKSPEQKQWLERLEREYDNIHVVLAWKREGEKPLRLVGALWRFWFLRGHISAGREWLENTLNLNQEADPLLRAKALNGVGVMAMVQSEYAQGRAALEESAHLYRQSRHKAGLAAVLNNLSVVVRQQGDYSAALACIQEAIELARQAENKKQIADYLVNMGVIAREQANPTEARLHFEEALTLYRELGNTEGIARTLMDIGVTYQDQADYAQARTCYEQSLELRRTSEDRWNMAGMLGNLGGLALIQQDYPAAYRFLGEALAMGGQLGDRYLVAHFLVPLAALATEQQQFLRAARLLGAEEGLRAATNTPLHASLRVHHERAVEAARAALGSEDFSAAWAEGHALSLEQAVALALG